MYSSQTSRLEAHQQLSVDPSSGVSVPEQSSELQACVSSNAAASQDLQDNQGLPAPADPSAAAYSPDQPLITNKSNKLEWQEGEDAKLKQMLWVVENLQEELFRAQEYRLQAEKKQQRHRSMINSLQAELQSVTGALAALDDDLDMIQQQLEHQMQAQDQNQDDARELDKELMSLQALIHVRERNIAEKDRRIADIEKQILNDIEDAKAAKRREQADNASPRSNASSPWGSASESDEELNFRVSPARRSLSNYAKESLLPPAQRGEPSVHLHLVSIHLDLVSICLDAVSVHRHSVSIHRDSVSAHLHSDLCPSRLSLCSPTLRPLSTQSQTCASM
ncbi:TPA: hypothetical protein ACH3X2_004923 [Trebouxia sp. C0005]